MSLLTHNVSAERANRRDKMDKIECEGVGDNNGFFECATGGLSDSSAIVRVPWPKDSAPIRIDEKCPICGANLLLDAGDACELDDNGDWIASEIGLSCEKEPSIDSDDWYGFCNSHYRYPYIDWLPLNQKVLEEVQKKYYFAP